MKMALTYTKAIYTGYFTKFKGYLVLSSCSNAALPHCDRDLPNFNFIRSAF